MDIRALQFRQSLLKRAVCLQGKADEINIKATLEFSCVCWRNTAAFILPVLALAKQNGPVIKVSVADLMPRHL